MNNITSRQTKLKDILKSSNLEFILEAHNGISARLVEQAGFKGIWASGLALSAQFGVRDSNEASWTQIVDMLEFMTDATSIPILLDGDTGYGNFNNMRRLVRKLEQRNIAGVCIEDKQFPKTNSFLDSDRQALADIDEFCGKIKAGKDSQSIDDFCIVARVEALIAGWGMREAITRAEAYFDAGADAILIHSKNSDPGEVLEFSSIWENRCPLVIIPTKYYSTPTSVFADADISLVIWANHMIRASIYAMESVSQEIYQNESIVDVEDKISQINKIFSLQGADELDEANKKYLTPTSNYSAMILAASRGSQFKELTKDKPKAMLNINGVPLLQRLTTEFKEHGVNDINVVAGYKSDMININGVKITKNPEYDTSNELVSLFCAVNSFTDNMIIIYGDLLFRSYILNDFIEAKGNITIVVDSANIDKNISGMPDFVYCDKNDDRSLFRQDANLKYISELRNESKKSPSGRWIGMLKVNNIGRQILDHALTELSSQENFKDLTIPDLINHILSNGHEIKVHYINGHWLDVNDLVDIERAGDFISTSAST